MTSISGFVELLQDDEGGDPHGPPEEFVDAIVATVTG